MTVANLFNAFEDVFITDSMPLEICKNLRADRSTICKEAPITSPAKGYCASQKMYYYGYKLHLICGLSGVIQSVDITPASVHDVNLLEDVKYQISDCTLLADKGYISANYQLDLFEHSSIGDNADKKEIT